MRLISMLAILTLLYASGCAAPSLVPTAAPSPSFTPSPSPRATFHLLATPYQTMTFTPGPDYTPTSSPTPWSPPASMALVFSDEFDGSALDSAKWNPCYPWNKQGCTNSGNHEQEWYLPDEILVENGMLRLRARPNPVKASDGNTYPYTSGMVSSHGKFSITYGYFEIRARMPKGKGLWPAFWLLPQDGEWPPEIDVLELLCQDTHTVYTTLHYKTTDNPHLSSGSSIQAEADLSADFHRYGVNWTPDAITWYLDGQEIYRLKHNIPAQPMYILANLAVGGDWPGSPDAETVFPAYFEIDYIRVYRDPSLPVPAFTPPAP